MTGMTFTAITPPAMRLDLSALAPARLNGLSEREIAALPLAAREMKVKVGDVFRIAMGDAGRIRIAGATPRMDSIGLHLAGGEILVDGDAGAYAGCGLSAGKLVIKGSAGPWAGAGQAGGFIEIGRDCGDYPGGPVPGAAMGMRNGLIHIKGNSGDHAGQRMRRGMIVIEGRAGAYPGGRMLAGTLVVLGGTGAYPGYLMKRGSIIADGPVGLMSPSFNDCGLQELTMLRLVERHLHNLGSAQLRQSFAKPVRRFAGDMAALGRGEILRFEG